MVNEYDTSFTLSAEDGSVIPLQLKRSTQQYFSRHIKPHPKIGVPGVHFRRCSSISALCQSESFAFYLYFFSCCNTIFHLTAYSYFQSKPKLFSIEMEKKHTGNTIQYNLKRQFPVLITGAQRVVIMLGCGSTPVIQQVVS